MTYTAAAEPFDHRLTVFGADWCPDVRSTRGTLDHEGVPYRYVNVDHDPQAVAIVRRLQRGGRRIPTLLWDDGTFLVEPSDDALRAHLATAGR